MSRDNGVPNHPLCLVICYVIPGKNRGRGQSLLPPCFTPWPCEALLLSSYILGTVNVASPSDYVEAGKKICMSRSIIDLHH